MGIRQKFFALAGIIGAMVIVISSIGYYTAYTHLNNSIEDAMKGEVAQQSDLIDGWLQVKGRTAVAAANLLQTVDDTTGVRREMMSLMGTDKEIDDLVNGNENGVFMGWKAGEITGQIDPRVRPWYKDAKAAGKLIFTNAYQSATGDKQIVVSAAVPYYDSQGKFRGAICEDILLGTLKDRVAQVKYRGAGEALIIEKATGKVLAASDAKETFTDISNNAVLKDRFAEMAASGQGGFTIEKNGMPEMFVYTTVNSTGWIIGMAVPESVVYAELQAMKMTYGLLTLISIILMVWGCIRFAGSITRPIISLKGHADQLAAGNLQIGELTVESKDEIGSLTQAFNTMSTNLRDLIAKMSAVSEQVAAASEELTASAQQSAEASAHVAETVGQVASGMEVQLKNIDAATDNVRQVAGDIEKVADKSAEISQRSAKASDSAQTGQTLMNDAVGKMENIEGAVTKSAEVVTALGANSQQIGQIVDTIAGIAAQTNLLALNAAIEAARAGEQGRGFAVVAEEVRKLAEQSGAATEQIRKLIGTIQKDTEQAVTSMQNGTDEVKQGTKAIRDVGGQFQAILSMVTDINTGIKEVSAAVQGVSTGSGRIVKAVGGVDEIARQTADRTQTISAATQEQTASTEEIASAAHSLAQMAMDMQNIINQFKI